ncbi:MAG: SBBP repeat-containing protein, partial [Chloroflexota bacterium]|nr:SBBP repeat-containing protein [Chloroflexota bacterium]
LYASQFSASSEGDAPGPGNVVRIGADGAAEVVVDGLVTPNGITFDDAGNLYVVASSAIFGPPGPPAGQVLRCDGVAPVAEVAVPADAAATPVT